MKQHPGLASDAGAFFDWLNCANFIVGVHDADKNRARRDRAAQFAGIDASGTVDRQIGHPGAELFEKPARFEDSWVLDAGGDDVVALFAMGEERALQREIVRFAAAAGKDDFRCVTAEQFRDLAAPAL